MISRSAVTSIFSLCPPISMVTSYPRVSLGLMRMPLVVLPLKPESSTAIE